MKKVISLLLIMVLFLSGCSGSENNSLENKSWNFLRIVETETQKVLFSTEKELSKYDSAKIIDLSCSANATQIILKDAATGNEWTLDYAENKTAETNNPDGAIYDITYTSETETVKGYATTGIANLNDADGNDYLIITIGGYELHFSDLKETIIS